jgi:hypothetical protein
LFGGDFLGDPSENKREGLPTQPTTNLALFHVDTKQFEATVGLPEFLPKTFSPDNKSVFWVEKGNVYSYSFSDKTRTQWTRFEAPRQADSSLSTISFSPDARSVAWVYDGNLYSYSFDGQTRTQWTHFPSRFEQEEKRVTRGSELSAAFGFIGWSHDESKVFFSCERSGRQSANLAICESSLANPEVKNLSSEFDSLTGIAGYGVSPDKRYIYSKLDDVRCEKIDLETGEVTQMRLDSPGVRGRPYPSPSGKTLLFESNLDDALWLMNADGSGTRRIVADGKDPQWRSKIETFCRKCVRSAVLSAERGQSLLACTRPHRKPQSMASIESRVSGPAP